MPPEELVNSFFILEFNPISEFTNTKDATVYVMRRVTYTILHWEEWELLYLFPYTDAEIPYHVIDKQKKKEN